MVFRVLTALCPHNRHLSSSLVPTSQPIPETTAFWSCGGASSGRCRSSPAAKIKQMGCALVNYKQDRVGANPHAKPIPLLAAPAARRPVTHSTFQASPVSLPFIITLSTGLTILTIPTASSDRKACLPGDMPTALNRIRPSAGSEHPSPRSTLLASISPPQTLWGLPEESVFKKRNIQWLVKGRQLTAALP